MRKIGLFLALLLMAFCIPISSGCANTSNQTFYKITCELNENVLTAKESVTFYNDTDKALSQLKFNLHANAFRQGAKYSPISSQYQNRAYPNGLSYGSMQIISCEQNNSPLQFSIGGKDQNLLIVELADEIYPSESVTIQIEFKLTLANVIARTGYNDCTINLGNFYPILCAIDNNGFYECLYYSCGDPFYSECADYLVSITLDKDYVVASSGGVESQTKKDNKQTITFDGKNIRSFCMVLSKQFKCLEQTVLGTKISYYYYDDQTPEDSLDMAVKSFTLFSNLFGNYPYAQYSVVQTKFIQGGMEYPSLVMISDNLDGQSYGEVIVHETAHQWWQTVVGNNEIEYGFLDEGLAEYSVVLFYENHPEYGLERANLIRSAQDTYKLFCTVSDKILGRVNTVMLRGLNDFTSEYEYVNMAYIKPCIMYDYLRNTIGDKTFFKGLSKYYKDYSFKQAIPDDLVGAFEKVGADTNGFFHSFFEGKVII